PQPAEAARRGPAAFAKSSCDASRKFRGRAHRRSTQVPAFRKHAPLPPNPIFLFPPPLKSHSPADVLNNAPALRRIAKQYFSPRLPPRESPSKAVSHKSACPFYRKWPGGKP